MSWLAKSLANSLLPDHREDDDGEDGEIEARRRKEELGDENDRGRRRGDEHEEEDAEYEDPSRGVKEDLSELTKTLTRQFWGVASFLAPPPTSPSDADADAASASVGRRDPALSSLNERESPEESDPPPSIAGMRSDLAEIGGRFRSGISKLSSHKAVTEGISRIKSTFLPFGSGDDEYDDEGESEEGSVRRFGGGAIGVTEEVMAFVRNISMHPETWLDFPLLPDDEESDDFDISDAQQEHALAVESLCPRLAALRIELCPIHMSEGCFWKIYFVLLHPRLSKHDAELLSTPQIVEARALLLQKLQDQTKHEAERMQLDASYIKLDESVVRPQELVVVPKDVYETSYSRREEIGTPASPSKIEREKHPIHLTDVEVIDKSVIEEETVKQLQKDHTDSSKIYIERFDEEGDDDWLEQEAEEIGASGTTTIPLVDDEDVSFSDLEEDDDSSTANPKK